MTLVRTLAAALLGLIFSSAVLSITMSFHNGHGLGALGAVILTPYVFLFMVVMAGPGALLLGWLHSILLERYSRSARTTSQIRQVGLVLGLPLGLANFILTLWVFSGPVWASRPVILSSELLTYVFPALAGGAGLGLGASVGLKPPGRARPTPLRRIRLTKVNRQGPPFFDDRPNQSFGRTS